MEKILIIDDSVMQAMYLKKILNGDYDVTLAHTANDGLICAKTGEYSQIGRASCRERV